MSFTLTLNPASLCNFKGCSRIGTRGQYSFTPQGYRWETVMCDEHCHPSAVVLEKSL
jgi:hypothetical protein